MRALILCVCDRRVDHRSDRFYCFGFPPSWPIAIGILALSHALVLWPTLSPNSQWLGPVMTRFETDANEVWLTIDDGPTEDTPALLDALDARGVKATFFVKGVARRTAAGSRKRDADARAHRREPLADASIGRVLVSSAGRRVAWQIDRMQRRAGERRRKAAPFPRAGRDEEPVRSSDSETPRTDDRRLERARIRFVRRRRAARRRSNRAARHGRLDRGHASGTRLFGAPASAASCDALQAKGYSFVVPAPERLKTKR